MRVSVKMGPEQQEGGDSNQLREKEYCGGLHKNGPQRPSESI